MPYKNYFKTIQAPSLGVVSVSDEAHAISPQAWFTLQQLRCRLSLVSNFPGWHSILASGNLGTMGSLLIDFFRQNGTNELIAGGSTKLFKYSALTELLTDISGALSFSPTRQNPWSAVIYNDVLYLTCRANGLHKYTGTGNVTAIATGPLGWHINTLKDHLVVFGVGSNGQRINWSSEASETDWIAGTTDTAGQFDLIDTPDQATGLWPLNDYLVPYKTRNIYILPFVGGNDVFGQNRRVTGTGLVAPYAIVPFRDIHIGMGEHFFWSYDGGTTVDDSIGSNITERVYREIHPVLKNVSRALYLKNTDEIIFAYPDVNALLNANKAVVYNRKTGAWYGPFSINVDMFASAILGFGDVIDDVTDIIDTVTDIIDSPTGETGAVFNIFADSNGIIHSLDENDQLANGVPITRIAESGDIFLGLEGMDTFGRAIAFPLGTVFRVTGVSIDFLDINQLENISFQIGSKMELNDPIVWSEVKTIYSTALHNIWVPIVQTGRWFRLKLTLAAGARMKLTGYQFSFHPTGLR